MIDTIRLSINDRAFYRSVINWRQNDLGGIIPARINADVLRDMIEDGKVIDLELYREKKIRDVLDQLNEHGLEVIIKDFFQLRNMGSWCRDITCIIDEYNKRILIELSLPKFINGQNVDLLYNYKTGILDFVTFIYTYFRCKLPSLEQIQQIEISRLDICYYYKFPSQIHANDFIRSFKSWCVHKRKKVHYYDTSVMFVGRSYSLKFYQKYDEFQKHDKKDILKNISTLLDANSGDIYKDIEDYQRIISYCETLSTGMVRCEFTLRKQKLNYDGICTLNDLFELDLITYYENLLESMGVLTMGHTQKDDYFNKLKESKKLLHYCALLEMFGKDKIKELYHRQTIYTYNKLLQSMQISMDDFQILKSVDLHIRNTDKVAINATSDEYETSLKFVSGQLF